MSEWPCCITKQIVIRQPWLLGQDGAVFAWRGGRHCRAARGKGHSRLRTCRSQMVREGRGRDKAAISGEPSWEELYTPKKDVNFIL